MLDSCIICMGDVLYLGMYDERVLRTRNAGHNTFEANLKDPSAAMSVCPRLMANAFLHV